MYITSILNSTIEMGKNLVYEQGDFATLDGNQKVLALITTVATGALILVGVSYCAIRSRQ